MRLGNPCRETWPDKNYIPLEYLEDSERAALELQFARLTALGAKAYDAIIDVENIMRRLRQARREGSKKSTARIIFDASYRLELF